MYNTDGKTCLTCPPGLSPNTERTACEPPPPGAYAPGDAISGFTLIYRNDSSTDFVTKPEQSGLSNTPSDTSGSSFTYYSIDNLPQLIPYFTQYNYIMINAPRVGGFTYFTQATAYSYTNWSENKKIYVYKKNKT
jgi:hypothetical protein